MNLSSGILAAALMAAAAPWLVAPAAAAPISSPLALQNAAAPLVETVQYRRGWRGGYRQYRRGWRGGYRGRGFGGVGIGAGLAAGAIIGGLIAPPPYPYGYGYYGPGYAYGPGVAYCQQRFRSYDPASGTYLGFDGLRHPCP